jgi:phosphoglycerate dehydrogenase-like enzyme
MIHQSQLSYFTAELILGEIIFLARQISDRHNEMKKGYWNKVSIGAGEGGGRNDVKRRLSSIRSNPTDACR